LKNCTLSNRFVDFICFVVYELVEKLYAF
jgi:hypothetical protein